MTAAIRPTLRTLASEAKVSPMTVSLALRHHPSISASMRTRLQRLAEARGYRPDPTIAKLMHHLRAKRHNRVQAGLCTLTDVPRRNDVPHYWTEIVRGVRERAQSLGFLLEEFCLADYRDSPGRLARTLRARGVEGVLLMPMTQARDVTPLLDWGDFAAVATSYSVLAPKFHRVAPYMFGNVFAACQTLVARGYRRIGLALASDVEQRTFHHFTAAMAWHNEHGAGIAVRTLIAPELNVESVGGWLDRERPDVVLSNATSRLLETIRATGRRVPQDIGVVYHTRALNPQVTTIDEKPAEIGSTAVDIITAMIQRGEKGIPGTAKVTMIEGGWYEGKTVHSAPRLRVR
jgi:LacI family transcriptional regulator